MEQQMTRQCAAVRSSREAKVTDYVQARLPWLPWLRWVAYLSAMAVVAGIVTVPHVLSPDHPERSVASPTRHASSVFPKNRTASMILVH